MFLSNMSHTKQRITMSVIIVAILAFSISFSQHPLFRPLFVLLTAGIICFAQAEYYRIVRSKGFTPLARLGFLTTLAFVICDYIGIAYPQLAILPQATLWLMLIAIFFYYFFKGNNPLGNIAITLFGIFYLTIPLSLVVNIAYFFPSDHPQNGGWWLFYLLLITKMTDTGAYFVGRKFGKSKMTPYISPKKTWEGAAGGLTIALLASFFFFSAIHHFFEAPPLPLTLFQSFWLACAISLLAQFGDLAESLLKRDAGIKDSSHLPGLGGALDIVDSVIFTCPFIYFFLKCNY